MAKKPGKRKQKPSRSERPPGDLPSLPDWRALEGVLHEIELELSDEPGDQNLSAAQMLIYDAFEAASPKQRVDLAKRALQISPDCADAYVLLSEQASNTKEVLDLLQKGVAAGERALGKRCFQEHAGHFWGLIETRPYMRARAALSQCLWTLGRREGAVEHCYDLLRLNPNDNQGIRYTLGAYLLDLARDADLRQLLSQYDDEGTTWLFNRAILEFRKSGDITAAKEALLRACEANSHVPEYLLGLNQLPSELPAYISSGEPSEAIAYTVDHMSGWKATPGALAWLRKVLKAPLPEAPHRTAPSWPRLSKALAQLPQAVDEVWQVDIRPFASVVKGSPQQGTPWMVLVTSPADDAVLAFEMELSRPDAKLVWDYLVGAMLHPKEGDPQRPARIEVRLKSFCTAWGKKLDEVEITCVARRELDHIDRVLLETIAPLTPDDVLGNPAAKPESHIDPAELVQHVGRAWQADIRRLPVWVGDDGEPRRPWSVLVTDRDSSLVLAQDLSMEEPSPEWLADNVLKAMREPSVGEPHRPGVVQVLSPEYARALQPRLAAAGVEVEVCADLAEIDQIFGELSSRVAGPDKMAPLLEVPGVEPRQAAEYFSAAAEFYKKAPWRFIPGDAPIKVECSKFQSGPWYAVVMGQSAMTFGLALYEGLDVLRAILHERYSHQGAARNTSALSLTYGEAFEIPIRDLEAIEKNGWPVAAPEAYPSVMRVNPGLAVRPPLAWELELVEGCLRVLPEFVQMGNCQTARFQVGVASGELELVLSHMEEV